jgi:hypothetical protein
MKRSCLFIIAPMLAFTFQCCKPQKNNPAVSEQPETLQTSSPSYAQELQMEKSIEPTITNEKSFEPNINTDMDTIRMYWVSFYSIGGGIDISKAEGFNALMQELEADGTVKVERVPWGREGEVDFCIDLLKLDSDRKQEIIRQIQLKLKDAKHVHQKLNGACKKRGR